MAGSGSVHPACSASAMISCSSCAITMAMEIVELSLFSSCSMRSLAAVATVLIRSCRLNDVACTLSESPSFESGVL